MRKSPSVAAELPLLKCLLLSVLQEEKWAQRGPGLEGGKARWWQAREWKLAFWSLCLLHDYAIE